MHAEAGPGDATSDTRAALALVAGFLAVRLVGAWLCPATVDEAYGIAVSRGWSLSYFDHPPVCFTLARLAAWLTGSESVFVARLPFVLAGTAAAWLVYDIGRLAYGSRAGLWALAWFSVAPFFLVSAGHFVVPDGPLDLALLLTLRLVLPDLLAPDRPPHPGRWAAAGAAFALALASKYQAVLFGAAALAFLVSSPPHRRLLRAPATWLALAIATLGLVPTLLWNASHGWVSLGFQAGRAGTASRSLQPVNFLLVLGGQMLYVLPGTWLVILAAAARGIVRPRSVADRLFGWLAFLPPVLFLAVALVSRRSLPHWAMSGFLCGFPLVGAWSARVDAARPRLLGRTWLCTAAAVTAAFLGFAAHARHAILAGPLAAVAGRVDLDWQHLDWSALAEAWPDLGGPREAVVLDWATAAKVAHAVGPGVAITPLAEPHHFQFLAPPAEPGPDAPLVLVHPARAGTADRVLAETVPILAAHGYRPAGEPRVIPQRAGDLVRFEIIALPIRRSE